MNKKILIAIGVFILVLIAAWLIFRSPSSGGTPSNAPVSTDAPFGTPEVSSSPNLPADFEGALTPLTDAQSGAGTTTSIEQPKLFRIESSPVAGFVVLTRGSSTVVRYAERATGHIFETVLVSGSLTKTRLTNQTIPQIYEAHFRADGNSVLFRSLDEVDTVKNMSLALTPPKATSTDALWSVSMTLLRGTMEGISVGAGDSLSYVLPESSAVVSSKFNGEGVKTLFANEFTAWRTVKFGNNLLLFSKPSASIAGYAYNLSQGALTRLAGPGNGLIATANPQANYLLYSYTDGNYTHLIGKDVAKGSEVELTPGTLADKCVGSTSKKSVFYCGAPSTGIFGNAPDAWYQGKAHFSDEVWSFDALTGISTLILDPTEEFGATLDVALPALSANDGYLVFINERDLSLWALSLR